jgi:hypothetical protein
VNFFSGKKAGSSEAKLFLAGEVVTQIGDMRVLGSKEKIALRTIVSGMADDFFKLRIEGNLIQRHLNVDGRGKLRAHAAHALAGGALALRAFPLDHQHAFAARMREMPGDAGANNAAPNDDYVCCLHAT